MAFLIDSILVICKGSGKQKIRSGTREFDSTEVCSNSMLLSDSVGWCDVCVCACVRLRKLVHAG